MRPKSKVSRRRLHASLLWPVIMQKEFVSRRCVCELNVERGGCESEQRRQMHLAANERVVFRPSIVPAPSAIFAWHNIERAHH